ncbi:peptide ABC transporter substrate-binding protein [Pseudomonas syringae pv. spinaceae]|uniref:Peptide ABC transporter substrate-binding protein n=1 Tax=Pseudomonas syringae pv. spinaceae TaxID=264459 RepID=A0A0Q0GA16_PSESX|nr:peptide ABC transporter substrate-binding protein [Pseudomonas syringae pv. spinaceae]
MFDQLGRIARRHHNHHACERQNRSQQRARGQVVAQAGYRQPQCHHRHQRLNDAHVGGSRETCGEIRQALIHRGAEHGEDENLAQQRFDRRTVCPDRLDHEGREQQTCQRPAIKTYFSRKDHPGRSLGDSSIDRPDEHGDQWKSVLHERVVIRARCNYPPVGRECQRQCVMRRHRLQQLDYT